MTNIIVTGFTGKVLRLASINPGAGTGSVVFLRSRSGIQEIKSRDRDAGAVRGTMSKERSLRDAVSAPLARRVK